MTTTATDQKPPKRRRGRKPTATSSMSNSDRSRLYRANAVEARAQVEAWTAERSRLRVRGVASALAIKELSRAQAALQAAANIYAQANDLERAKKLRDQIKTVAEMLSELAGSPPISLQELLG